MAMRNIVKIDESKCDGCGLCIGACAEGAIAIIDGKARLVSEIYCDGLGACLGHCPQDAITVEQREAADFDEEATKSHLANQAAAQPSDCAGGGFTCPGSMARSFTAKGPAKGDSPSALGQWPVQLHLVSPSAPYFKNADLLLAADCVPFAMGDFHERLLQGRAIAIGCPKLDDADSYIDKLADIIRQGRPKSLTVVHMEVPCCSGLVRIAREAISRSGSELTFEDITIDLRGSIIR